MGMNSFPNAMRSVLPNSGTRMSAASTALCRTMEIARERRRLRISRRRCSGSPSTKHPHKEPRSFSDISSEIFSGSRDITHLHKVFCRSGRLCGASRQSCRVLRRRLPGGCSKSPENQRRARRDVRGSARPHFVGHQGWRQVPWRVKSNHICQHLGGIQLKNDAKSCSINDLHRTVSECHSCASHLMWTWIKGGQSRWTGVT